MPAARDDISIAEFTIADYPVVHVLWQRGDLWMRPSDGPEATLLKLTLVSVSPLNNVPVRVDSVPPNVRTVPYTLFVSVAVTVRPAAPTVSRPGL